MTALLATLCSLSLGAWVGWIARGESIKRPRAQFPAVQRFRTTKAALRGALRERETR